MSCIHYWLLKCQRSYKVSKVSKSDDEIVDLKIQGAPAYQIHYFEGISWFLRENPAHGFEVIQKTINLRNNSSFSAVFTLIFFDALLSTEEY